MARSLLVTEKDEVDMYDKEINHEWKEDSGQDLSLIVWPDALHQELCHLKPKDAVILHVSEGSDETIEAALLIWLGVKHPRDREDPSLNFLSDNLFASIPQAFLDL